MLYMRVGTLPEPRSNKEGQGSRAHRFRLFGHLAGPHPLVSNVYMSPLVGRFLSVLSVVLTKRAKQAKRR
jgi:hypothetical protein